VSETTVWRARFVAHKKPESRSRIADVRRVPESNLGQGRHGGVVQDNEDGSSGQACTEAGAETETEEVIRVREGCGTAASLCQGCRPFFFHLPRKAPILGFANGNR